MSRINISGTDFDYAVGVDHVTGVFFQVWKKPADDQDGCFLKIEGKTLIADENTPEYQSLPKRGLNYIKDCVSRMQSGEGDYLGGDHICNMIRSLDSNQACFEPQAIYNLLD